MRTSNIQCVVCQEWFTAKRSDAKTCKPACRQLLCAAKKGRDVKSIVAVREEYFVMLMEIRANKPEAAAALDTIIKEHGAVVGEWAIIACMRMVL
jgi:hypothetical protein